MTDERRRRAVRRACGQFHFASLLHLTVECGFQLPAPTRGSLTKVGVRGAVERWASLLEGSPDWTQGDWGG